MDSPSWTDVLHSAFGSCLHCFKSTSRDNDSDSVQRPPRYLESLLTEPLLDTDTEAEIVSLHSSVGDNNRRRRKQKQKQVTFFGFDLFGKRSTGPIHLPEDEEEVDELLRRSRRQKQRSTRISSPSLPSAITFDGSVSDAAPLDSAVIDERVIEEEERRAVKEREKEERRRKRKERKEMKKLAQVLLQNEGQGEFEGFQGSGGSYPHLPAPFQQEFLPSPNSDDFGPYLQAHNHAHADGEEDDAADLDGGLYAARKPNEGGSSSSGGGSDSRRSPKGTSMSRSDYSDSLSQANDFAPFQSITKKKSSKSSASTSSSSKTKSTKSRSSASATSSERTTSLASPISSIAEDKPSRVAIEGLGFPRSGFGNLDSERSFPSPGLGTGGFNGAPRNGMARGGAFLASRD
ncbi:hypothetical protein J3R30DRAFT_2367291 [Lentinula aciculospora]|uniref:Uncharacterized protein n=1 Tax=Lentinula aciculospora TaxID=153920 RepID=A0A9W9DQD1_9AGAR|nr:hypothetical protein J3R30DRAFT_2367291 [Lentinula aciculospora]